MWEPEGAEGPGAAGEPHVASCGGRVVRPERPKATVRRHSLGDGDEVRGMSRDQC
jgi:hypothetical protein